MRILPCGETALLVECDSAAGVAPLHVLLAGVGSLTGLTPEAVVAAHTGRPWRVAFSGFAPGFAYLDGGYPRLVVPRLATPRTVVPAGAVLWDTDREPPALLRPGWWVRFVAVDR